MNKNTAVMYIGIISLAISLTCQAILFQGDYEYPYSPYTISRTTGTSMLPTISDGSIVLCKCHGFDRDNISNGTIIAYWNTDETTLVLHRIIYVGDGFYVCKGDNNHYEDYPVVYPEQIRGIFIMVLWPIHTSHICIRIP